MALSTDPFNGVNLALLPAPQVIEPLDFDTIFADALADLRARDPSYASLTLGDPAIKVIEVCVYREMLLRQRLNEAALSIMPAFATGSDLDHLASLYGLTRFVRVAGDPANGIAAILEDDSDFRNRIVRSPEAGSVAGPVGAYMALAVSAHPDIKFVSVTSPAPAMITIAVQSRSGNGTANAAVLAAVNAAVSADTARPLGDRVTVVSAAVIPFAIEATIKRYAGTSAADIATAARASLANFLSENCRLGRDITTDAVIAALRVPGVQKVTLTSPAADIIVSDVQVAYAGAAPVLIDGGIGG